MEFFLSVFYDKLLQQSSFFFIIIILKNFYESLVIIYLIESSEANGSRLDRMLL
jgi:hypothetical protein